MSDVIAGVRVNGEMLVCIDYDKPVWQNANYEGLTSTPSLKYFMADGILGSASMELLSKYGITKRYTEEDFWSIKNVARDVRKVICDATDLDITYFFYDDEPNYLIIGNLMLFETKYVLKKVDEKTFYQLIKPQY